MHLAGLFCEVSLKRELMTKVEVEEQTAVYVVATDEMIVVVVCKLLIVETEVVLLLLAPCSHCQYIIPVFQAESSQQLVSITVIFLKACFLPSMHVCAWL